MNIENYIKYFESLAKGINPEKEPGFCSAVLHKGEIIHSLNHGLASMEHQSLLTNDSLFYLASVSKQFTAACILKLVHDKTLKLNQDVRSIVKETKHFSEKITIQNLLNHTSGIADYFEYINCWRGLNDGDYFDNEDILKVISNHYDIKFQPNSKMEYSNSNYIVLAQVVKKCTGLTLGKFAKKHIFTPVGMKSTIFDEDRYKVTKNRVCSYTQGPTKAEKYRLDLKNSCTVGDGGVLSSINDLIKWELNFSKNKALEASVINGLSKSVKLANGEPNYYANGLELSPPQATYKYTCHGGSFAGFITFLIRIPSQKVSMIYLSNNETIPFDLSQARKK